MRDLCLNFSYVLVKKARSQPAAGYIESSRALAPFTTPCAAGGGGGLGLLS